MATAAAALICLSSLILEGLQSIYIMCITQPQLHADEWFTSLDAQHVPWFWFGQQLAHRTL
jgi:hypothetical protein